MSAIIVVLVSPCTEFVIVSLNLPIKAASGLFWTSLLNKLYKIKILCKLDASFTYHSNNNMMKKKVLFHATTYELWLWSTTQRSVVLTPFDQQRALFHRKRRPMSGVFMTQPRSRRESSFVWAEPCFISSQRWWKCKAVTDMTEATLIFKNV